MVNNGIDYGIVVRRQQKYRKWVKKTFFIKKSAINIVEGRLGKKVGFQ